MLDFWSAEDSKQRSVDVLVVTDHFTKLAHAFPCVNQKAKQIAKKLWDHVFCIYGFPTRIHTDQGTNFESTLVAELLKLAGIEKSHTTAYHPMGNAEQSGSIGPWVVCFALCLSRKNTSGPSRYRL